MNITLFTDGGARGNPGPAGIGIVIKDHNNQTISTHREYIGNTTNNEAEYQGIIKGLRLCLDLKPDQITAYMDSELVIKQLNGVYKVRDLRMKAYFEQVQELLKDFKKVGFKHVRRDLNKEADNLVNQAIDDRQ